MGGTKKVKKTVTVMVKKTITEPNVPYTVEECGLIWIPTGVLVSDLLKSGMPASEIFSHPENLKQGCVTKTYYRTETREVEVPENREVEVEEEVFLPKEETSYKLSNDQEITIRPDDSQFGIPVSPEWYTWWRKGIPIGVHKEDKFQPQNRFAFSPLPYEPLSLEGAALLLLILNFARTPEGQKSLERIAIKYMDNIAKIVEHIQAPAKTHWAVGLNAQTSTAAILHRLGLIDDGGYEKIVDQSRKVFDKEWSAEFITAMAGQLTTLVEGSNRATTERAAAPPGATAAMTTTELGGIAAILKALK